MEKVSDLMYELKIETNNGDIYNVPSMFDGIKNGNNDFGILTFTIPVYENGYIYPTIDDDVEDYSDFSFAYISSIDKFLHMLTGKEIKCLIKGLSPAIRKSNIKNCYIKRIKHIK